MTDTPDLAAEVIRLRARAEAAEAEIARLRAMLDAVMDVEKIQPTGDPTDPLSWAPVASYVVAGSVHDAAITRADEAEARAEALAAEVTRLRAECFMLAAGACGGHYGDDHGHSRCTLVDAQRTRAEAAEALLREAGVMLEASAQTIEWLSDYADKQCDWGAQGDTDEALSKGRAARALAAEINAALGGDA